MLFDAAGLDAAIGVYGYLGGIDNAVGRDSPFNWGLVDREVRLNGVPYTLLSGSQVSADQFILGRPLLGPDR